MTRKCSIQESCQYVRATHGRDEEEEEDDDGILRMRCMEMDLRGG